MPAVSHRAIVEEATDSLVSRLEKIRDLIVEDDEAEPVDARDPEALVARHRASDERKALALEHALGGTVDLVKLVGHGVLAVVDALERAGDRVDAVQNTLIDRLP